ncbi:MAG: hypothetical protein Q8P40_14775, partial [Nitrospirota bacterium]|nr:hypothetical protein [Nitrospirota bacterium]
MARQNWRRFKTVTGYRTKNKEQSPPTQPSPSRGEGKGGGGSLWVSARPLLIPLWLSLLFLPFKGLHAALILFTVLSIFIVSLKFLLRYKKKLEKISQILINKIRVKRLISPHLLLIARYSLLLLLFIIPFMVRDYFIDVAILAGIYIILALGLNVVVGFAGLLNLGFVAFYAIGAYSYALLNTKFGLDFWSALPFSI